jgi:predicted AlkP superfamily pyrophosphatase or phosphodiesterase
MDPEAIATARLSQLSQKSMSNSTITTDEIKAAYMVQATWLQSMTRTWGRLLAANAYTLWYMVIALNCGLFHDRMQDFNVNS